MVRFSPTEFEIIEHRLVLDDCLGDCLEEEFAREEVEAACHKLQKQFKQNLIWEIDLASPVERAIIKDCCDGSTFFGSSEDAVASGEVSRGWLLSRQRAAKSLMEKLKSLEVSIPFA